MTSRQIRVSVIVPAYNERGTILELLTAVSNQRLDGIELEVIVIDDCSTDDTRDILHANPHVYTHLLQMPRNGGKGAAVLAGLAKASGEYVLFQDADLEYDPNEYDKIIMPVQRFAADIVIGSRTLAPPYTRVHYFWHLVGNRVISLLFNVINNTTFTDIYSCYLLYRRSLVDPSELATRGWEQQAELLTIAARRGKVFYEVPISYHGRSYEEGKKIRARHAIRVLWTILAKGLRRWR